MKPPTDMVCHELVELVTVYLGGGLCREERDRFDAHRHGCPGCTAYVSQGRLTVSWLRQLRSSLDEDLSVEQRRTLELFRTRGLHRRAPAARDIPLGPGSEFVALGEPVACFWDSERKLDATAGLLATGASLGETCLLIGHDGANERLMANLERRGLSVGALMQERQLQVASVRASAPRCSSSSMSGSRMRSVVACRRSASWAT